MGEECGFCMCEVRGSSSTRGRHRPEGRLGGTVSMTATHCIPLPTRGVCGPGTRGVCFSGQGCLWPRDQRRALGVTCRRPQR